MSIKKDRASMVVLKERVPMVILSLQEVVDMANFWLAIDSCIQYGLMEGNPPNVDKCIHYIELGKKHGVHPTPNWLPPDEVLQALFGKPIKS